MLSEHVPDNLDCHLAALGGTTMHLLNGQQVFQSVLVGVLIFLATNSIRLLVKYIGKKLHK